MRGICPRNGAPRLGLTPNVVGHGAVDETGYFTDGGSIDSHIPVVVERILTDVAASIQAFIRPTHMCEVRLRSLVSQQTRPCNLATWSLMTLLLAHTTSLIGTE